TSHRIPNVRIWRATRVRGGGAETGAAKLLPHVGQKFAGPSSRVPQLSQNKASPPHSYHTEAMPRSSILVEPDWNDRRMSLRHERGAWRPRSVRRRADRWWGAGFLRW